MSKKSKSEKAKLRRQQRMEKEMQPKWHQPRKLKKAQQHSIINGTTESDICVRTTPDGYPRTKWINQVVHNYLRVMAQISRKLEYIQQCQVNDKLHRAPNDIPINPALQIKERCGGRLVIDINQLFVRAIPFSEIEN